MGNEAVKAADYYKNAYRMRKRTEVNDVNTKDADIAIAYQNKDIVSKFFGDRMKGKPLSLFHLKSDLKVVNARPTNIPIVQARELRMDNLFELEDGSVAILDYESKYKIENFTKYGRYIMEVLDRYIREGKQPNIHMMVLYTADIERVNTVLECIACRIQVEASYLVEVPSEEWLEDAQKHILEGTVTDEVLMHLIILPLTYKGEKEKQKAIRQCADLARKIPDKEQESFVMAGILTFTDKVISEETKQYIKEVLGMTQVGKMLMDEARQQGLQQGLQRGDMERARKTALNMLKRGDSLNDVAEILELSADMIKSWEEGC